METFAVDDVEPAAEALPVRPLGDLFPAGMPSGGRQRGGVVALGGDPALPVLEPDGVDPLLSAVAQAFAGHRPLVLSPDAVWLTITRGVAQHILVHAEELRPSLVTHSGTKRLEIISDGPVPEDAESWRQLVERYGKLLGGELGGAGFWECDFSTSTGVEQVAGRIVMLEAYSPYFAVWFTALCGIPRVTLTGTPDDWRKIRSRVDGLVGWGLGEWSRSLAPIADQFVRAASGDADTGFWQRIYNPADAYGGEVITGWAARFYPYLSRPDGSLGAPNPLLALPLGEPRDLTPSGPMGYRGPGVRSYQVPASLSRVVVNVNDRLRGDNHALALHAGLVAVAQDDDGALRPVAGWHLTRAEHDIEVVLDRITREHHTTPPIVRDPSVPGSDLDFAPADAVALYRRIGSATLFDGAWRIRPVAEHTWLDHGDPESVVIAMIDLPGGHVLACQADTRTETIRWIGGRLSDADADPAETVVYGTSLAFLLAAALDSDGDLSHVETGRLPGLFPPPG